MLYGYSWYLDAVLPAPDWQWQAVVQTDAQDRYVAVLPIPLRRKAGRWVVHQPLFCPFLDVFTRDDQCDPTPFLQAVVRRFRYGSRLALRFPPALPNLIVQPRTTHVLDLSVGYERLLAGYTADRQLNRTRALRHGWQVTDETDSEPLLLLFRQHHAHTIEGGVGEWAYAILRRLIDELQRRELATLRYARHNNQLEAGMLIAHSDSRAIYLFNAASEQGRRGNARTLLLDQFIQQQAGQPVAFDFESPEKQSITQFYRSFGAVEETYYSIRWNRLTRPERWLLMIRRWLLKRGR
ncbi:GNAT family N-acetyltransferase [Spirosoma rhododendri]|uniref:GNAT family N-acetyltransferase n=1 Tax=Spirosoma rhododendri TaxID=2728024 RepID=A0A7L5DUS3_9BACT|nr:GNAT family N-acetyltransferase [Spirosoma rhododendri]